LALRFFNLSTPYLIHAREARFMSDIGGADIGLFALAERKMSWIDSRQKQLAQNIANADTPNYQGRDVAPFSAELGKFDIEPARTSPLHLVGFSDHLPGTVQTVAERAPDGNAVSLEGEMTKVADDDTSQALVGNLWKSYMGMFMTALGKSG
jgi:flagellar basal-body rod protein FlgB